MFNLNTTVATLATLAGNLVLFPKYMSDGPGYTGPLLCHVGPRMVQVVLPAIQDVDGNLRMTQIRRTEGFESDAPTVSEVLAWDEKYRRLVFGNLNESSREYCEDVQDVDPDRTAIVKWSDGSLGAIVFWGESCYVSALFFEGKWQGDYLFEMDDAGESLFVTREAATNALVLPPGQLNDARLHVDRSPSWIEHPVFGFMQATDLRLTQKPLTV